MRWFIIPLILAGSLANTGCAGKKVAPKREYRTVNADPRRDSERAKKQNGLGVKQLQASDFELAERSLKAALAADVMHGPAHNNLGKVYFHQRKYYLAAWEFQYATKLLPYQPEPRNNLAMVYEAVGKLDEAVAGFEQARSLDPDNPQFIGNLARARIRRGDRSADVREILEDLVMRETRPQWVGWAREQLALMRPLERPTTAPAIP